MLRLLFQSLGNQAQLWARRYELTTSIAEIRASVDAELLAKQKRLERELSDNRSRVAKLGGERFAFAAAVNFRASGAFQPTQGEPRDIFLLTRGDVALPDTEHGMVKPGSISALADLRQHFQLAPEHSEGDRRLALAEWIVDPQNPLTWRSIVNRVWQHHFGRGIVETENDFGRMGAQPTHPQLLDYLATRFRDGPQSLKALHRLIVTSATYRQSSRHHADNAASDSSNRFLWRMNRRRLDAEQVRDTILVVADKLNPKMFGPGFRPFRLKDDHSPHFDYLNYDPADPSVHRRSIYRFIVRSVPDPFFTSLDCADPSQIVARRSETSTALQALTMLNNQFTVHMAGVLADQIQQRESEPAKQVELAVKQVFGRSPKPQELELLIELARQHSLANVCRVLINSNEFMFVD